MIAEGGAKPAGFEKIARHVDDQQRRARRQVSSGLSRAKARLNTGQ